MTGTEAHTTAAGWIWDVHLRAFLDLVAHYVGYDFDATDRQAVDAALDLTDDEHPDRWLSHPLAGTRHHVEVHLARSADGDELSVRVLGSADPELVLRVSTLLDAYASSAPVHHA